ncbi:winged helix-turn-helix transcriptional regulator [Anaerosinus sp.]
MANYKDLLMVAQKMLMQQLELLIHKEIVINEKTAKNNTVESIYYLSKNGLGLLPILKSMIILDDKNLSCH